MADLRARSFSVEAPKATNELLRETATPESELRSRVAPVQRPKVDAASRMETGANQYEISNSPRGAAAGEVVPASAMIRGDEPGKSSGKPSGPLVATHAQPAAQLGEREGKAGASARSTHAVVRPTAGLFSEDVAQSVALRIPNPAVPGSSPGGLAAQRRHGAGREVRTLRALGHETPPLRSVSLNAVGLALAAFFIFTVLASCIAAVDRMGDSTIPKELR